MTIGNSFGIILAALLLVACEPEADVGADLETTGEEFRASVIACVEKDGDSCRLELNGDPCLPTEIDPCSPLIWWPMACSEPLGQCLVLDAGEECPAGWLDVCGYYQ